MTATSKYWELGYQAYLAGAAQNAGCDSENPCNERDWLAGYAYAGSEKCAITLVRGLVQLMGEPVPVTQPVPVMETGAGAA